MAPALIDRADTACALARAAHIGEIRLPEGGSCLELHARVAADRRVDVSRVRLKVRACDHMRREQERADRGCRPSPVPVAVVHVATPRAASR